MIKTTLLLVLLTSLHLTASVNLTESQVQWKTYKHTVNPDFTLLNDTFSTDIVTHTYPSIVLENELLKVTLVPEFGGRIISMIYKPTGHEQLYQNPVGTPYGPDWDVFFYDWLMVWGGIFPTFPEPEHGKAWCRPWKHEITKNTPQEITVTMSFTDDISFKSPSAQYKYGTTGITCTFAVTLSALSSKLKTSVTLTNAKSTEIPYEYWTNVGVAPGSLPGNTRCDDQTEIVGPVNFVKISTSWPDIQKVEQLESGEIYRFKNLRWYKNWTNDGIAYAWPVEGNFWGALNHANNEGIIRISENVKTPGLKIWGFGYSQSRGFNPETSTKYNRPFIELWAGVSKEFFTPAKLPAGSTLRFDEYYAPTTGLSTFTHASEHAIISLTTDKLAYNGSTDKNCIISCKYNITKPSDSVTIALQFTGGGKSVSVFSSTRNHDLSGPYEISDTIALKDLCSDIDSLSFLLRKDDALLMRAGVPVTLSNAGTCITAITPDKQRYATPSTQHRPHSLSCKHYSINGAYLGTSKNSRQCIPLPTGVVVTVDNLRGIRSEVRLTP